jgi:hypothetical protein
VGRVFGLLSVRFRPYKPVLWNVFYIKSSSSFPLIWFKYVLMALGFMVFRILYLFSAPTFRNKYYRENHLSHVKQQVTKILIVTEKEYIKSMQIL